MKLLLDAQLQKLIKNQRLYDSGEAILDQKPVVKLFGGGACTWLLSEYCPESGTFFGLCDLGLGCPELGYVSREELESIRFPPFGLGVERDRHWEADKTLREYHQIAKDKGRIVS